ncbi:ankyrin repeat-containing domain protein [Trichoderma compactum]
MLPQQSHYYAVNGLRDKIEALLSSYPSDESWGHLLIDYFKLTPFPSKSFSRILAKGQTPSPGLIFATILEDIPEKYHLWAQKLLSWMLSSFRPLRASEFCRISDLCLGDEIDANTDRSTIRDASPTSSANSEDYPVEDQLLIIKGWHHQTERDRHMTFVQTCLEHLKDETDQARVWATQLPYATEFWPLTIAAHFGFEDIVKYLLEKNEYDSETLKQGLIQAARAALLPVFRLLIVRYSDCLDLIKVYVQATLQAALRSENHELCHEPLIYVYLPGQRELRQQQPPEQRLEANDGLDVKDPNNHVQNTTKEETTPLKANSVSSCLRTCLACELEMTDIVAKLLSVGPDNDTTFLETTSYVEDTPLQVAAQYSRLDSAKLLIAAGTSVAPNSNREIAAPLEVAALHGSSDMTDLLLDYGAPIDSKEALLRHGADPNLGEDDGRTPLWTAVTEERIDICRLLLAHKADPNLVAKEGETTPLAIAIMTTAAHQVAAQEGYSEITRLLAEAKADVHACIDDSGWTALHAVSDSTETVRVLLEYGADINRPRKKEATPPGAAIHLNQVNAVKSMLSESKVKPDWSLPSNQRSIRHAVREGYTDVVSSVLEAGANVDLVGDHNASLVLFAMTRNDDNMIRTLLEFGADLNHNDKYGDTVLHFVEKETPVESVRPITTCNMEVLTHLMTKTIVFDTLNIPSFNKWAAPLHFACAEGTIEMVKVLIKNGADVNYACTSEYGTPLIAATIRSGSTRHIVTENIVQLLLDEGADPTISAGRAGYPLISASMVCSTEVIQLLLDGKASVDVRDPLGRKLAHLACYNMLKVLNFLKVPDSDFAARHGVGRVPLHYAVLGGQLILVEEVLAHSQRVGIGIDVLDDDGWTPLLWAARAPQLYLREEKLPFSQYDTIVSFLLSKGANPSQNHASPPQDKFEECGYDWDEEDEETDTESKAAQSVNGDIHVKGEENAEISFDDEVVEEEDMEL